MSATAPVAVAGGLLAAAREPGTSASELDEAAAALGEVDPGAITGDEVRIAFWVNLYNALVLHELIRKPRSGNLLRHRGMFSDATYEVGRHRYSLNEIEHGVLRLNARAPLALRAPFRSGDERLASLPGRLDPRIHFALNCAAESCPPIRSYDGDGLEAQLDLATRSYFSAEASVDREGGKVTLPHLLKLYAADFGDRRAQLEFAVQHLGADDAAWLRENADRARVGYGDYDWTIAS